MLSPLFLFGATSEIGGELAVALADGREVVLAARRDGDLAALSARLLAAGATKVHTLHFDAAIIDRHREIVERAIALSGIPGVAILSFGILGEQARAEHDESHTAEIALIDYTAQLTLITILSNIMTEGTLVAFSSIAGWRARRANYVYGSAKAGLDAFCQGLSDRLYGTKVRLITARPGFVIGKMTHGMSPAPLSVHAAEVATAVAAEVRQGTGSTTLWIPGRLRLLAWAMRLTPRVLWRKMPR